MSMIDDVTSETPISDDKGMIKASFASWVHRAYILLYANQESGTTAQRPTGSSPTQIWIGRRYYDTTLNKPVWASAVSGVTVTWRDAAGTIV